MNKATFIRNHPDLSARDLVAKAKAIGLLMSEMYVYSIRSKTRTGVLRPRTADEPEAAQLSRGPNLTEDLTAAIEAIVERKVNAILAERFRSLMGPRKP